MIRPTRWSTSRSAVRLAGAALLALVAAWPTSAAAQACCAGGALVNPVRLAPPEDYAVGLQTRVRGQLGSFDPNGGYLTSSSEQDMEQDLAASFRLARRAQVAAILPYLETHRTLSGGVGEWGSGIGDLALSARYDVRLASEMLYWPGLAVLASVVLPTGKAAGDGTNPASTDATGTGSTNVSLGVGFEKAHGPLYGVLNLWATYIASNTQTTPLGAQTTSYPLQFMATAIGGYVFDNEAAVALSINFLERGDDTLNGTIQPGTVLRLTTVGATGLVPLGDDWRVLASVFADLPISSFGRNEQAGAGVTATLVRSWH